MTRRELQANINEAKRECTRTRDATCYVAVSGVEGKIEPGLIVGKVFFARLGNVPYRLADIVNVWIETDDSKFYINA